MGHYLNPGNSDFQRIRNTTYIDQSGLIGLVNNTIGTLQKLSCFCRTHGFGKKNRIRVFRKNTFCG